MTVESRVVVALADSDRRAVATLTEYALRHVAEVRTECERLAAWCAEARAALEFEWYGHEGSIEDPAARAGLSVEAYRERLLEALDV